MRNPIVLLPILAALAACSPDSPFGFQLPAGDAAAGRRAFVDLRCNSCHEVRGIAIEYRGGIAHVVLGGETTRVKTYGELVTSIINPSHRIAPLTGDDGVLPDGQSVMNAASLNDVMTVRQLVDLVAFLQPTYRVAQPPMPHWYIYP